MNIGLPEQESLSQWLGVEPGAEARFHQALLAPLEEFLGNPGKGFRGQLVELTFGLVAQPGGAPSPLELGKELLEFLHAGSLVVDDIEDGSQFRRGKPTLHRSHGLPVALNAGNWLYFWPLEKVREWDLSAVMERDLYRLVHRCLSRAHFGQALDVGVNMSRVPDSEILPLCLASMQLKTGALTALATGLGVLLGGGSTSQREAAEAFGSEFGVALQMLDDIGNATGWKQAPGDPKRFEDLRLGRPSWLWGAAMECGQVPALRKASAALPDTRAIEAWLTQSRIASHGRGGAEDRVRRAFEKLNQEFGENPGLEPLQALAQRLLASYQ